VPLLAPDEGERVNQAGAPVIVQLEQLLCTLNTDHPPTAGKLNVEGDTVMTGEEPD
jgi:hypothetical protein